MFGNNSINAKINPMYLSIKSLKTFKYMEKKKKGEIKVLYHIDDNR